MKPLTDGEPQPNPADSNSSIPEDKHPQRNKDKYDKLFGYFGLGDKGRELYERVWASNVKYVGKIMVRKIQDPVTGRLNIAIILDGGTKKSDINKAMDAILKERELITKTQGPDLIGFLDYLLQLSTKRRYCVLDSVEEDPNGLYLTELRYSNANARELMLDINFDALVYFLCYAKQDGDASKEGKHYFYSLLQLMNFGDHQDITDLYEVSKAELDRGRCPWDIDGYPITKDKVENKLERLIDKFGDEARLSNSDQVMRDVQRRFFTRRCWESAMELLKKRHPDTYNKYKPRYLARISEIINQSPKVAQGNLHGFLKGQQKPPD